MVHRSSGEGSCAEPLVLTPEDSDPPPVHDSVKTEHEGAPRNSSCTRGEPYEVDQDDLIDQHVGYYLRHHPTIHARHAIRRNGPGVYLLDGRELSLEWQYAAEPGGQGLLVVADGPLKQPFADYMEMTQNNAEYDSESLNRSSLSQIPRAQRMSFHDQHKVYTRLEAMKVAKEQAQFREKHADYIKDGMEAPEDLLSTYKKTIQQKLGHQPPQRSQQSHERTPERGLPPGSYPYDRSPAHPSERRQGAIPRAAPPPPPPPNMAHVYGIEPMDVDMFSGGSIFSHFTGGYGGDSSRGGDGGRSRNSGNFPVWTPPPSDWSGSPVRGNGSQWPLPAPPPPSWQQASSGGYYDTRGA